MVEGDNNPVNTAQHGTLGSGGGKVDRSSFKDVGAAALQRQLQLEERVNAYLENPLVASLIFEPTNDNHLVEATYSVFRQFILRNEWHVKRVKASEDEKKIYKSHSGPKYWTYVGRTAQALKDTLLKGPEIRIPDSTGDNEFGDGASSSSSSRGRNSSKAKDTSKAKSKLTTTLHDAGQAMDVTVPDTL
jgi:hypothetical protein